MWFSILQKLLKNSCLQVSRDVAPPLESALVSRLLLSEFALLVRTFSAGHVVERVEVIMGKRRDPLMRVAESMR